VTNEVVEYSISGTKYPAIEIDECSILETKCFFRCVKRIGAP
jgi:hypothetical protein